MAARLAPGLQRRLAAEATGDVLFDRCGRHAADTSRESVHRESALACSAPAARAAATAAIAATPTIRDRGMGVSG
jgi:hypothetical protein